MKKFPIIKAGYIFNKFSKKIDNDLKIKYNSIDINYPCRLDAMAINPAAVTYNDEMIFTPGEVVISVEKYIKVKVRAIDEHGGNLVISNTTKRKVLVKHAYLLMCEALKVNPSLEISVDDNEIPKHSGFGSSSSTISAVSVAINEIYGNPIQLKDLIKYLASNHAEEVSDDNENELKVVQCIGGGATNGQTDEGIIIISGKSCTIAKMFYEGDILIAIPKDFVEQDAEVLMSLEEKNLWKFQKTGDKYKNEIAYTFLHKVLPDMTEGKIESLADIVFDYRFNMGSIDNCSFVFPRMNEIAKKVRNLYEDKHCQFLSLSSVGPAFFTITNNNKDTEYCIKEFGKLNMKIVKSRICNHKYEVVNKEENLSFWKDEHTNLLFYNKEPSQYITDIIDKLILENKIENAIDIGCGGGRYSKYLASKNIKTTAIDKNVEMFKYCSREDISKISFKVESMDALSEKANCYDLALSIGVLHNATSIKELTNALKEINRVLKKDGYAIISIFTNDVITSDLIQVNESDLYLVKNRQPMILLSKDKIKAILNDTNFNIISIVDEHITDVGGDGRRNVWTVLLQKQK